MKTSSGVDTDYSDDESSSAANIYGNLRTRLRWEPSSSTLHLDVRQQLETARSMESKLKGWLNTKTGVFENRFLLRKNFYTNTPSIAKLMASERGDKKAGDLNPDSLLPGGLSCLLVKDWSISPGFVVNSLASSSSSGSSGGGGASSSTPGRQQQQFNYLLSLKKQPQILLRRGPWDSWVTAKGNLELNPAGSEVAANGGLRFKLFKARFTHSQDVRLSAGLDYSWSSSKGWQQSPYLKLAETSWSVRARQGSWQFVYEL